MTSPSPALCSLLAATVGSLALAGCSASTADTSDRVQRTIRVTVADGHVVDDPGHVTVALGDHVVLKIAADVSDEIHVHGYDLMEDVAEGEPATIAFNADIPGQFEAELEQHHQTILEFDVR